MLDSVKVGIYLAIKDLARASKLTTLLIVFIMTLTFLNLTVGRGILVGLPKGSSKVFYERYSGDLIISKLPKDEFIIEFNTIENFYTKIPEIQSLTKRYLRSAKMTAGYTGRLRTNEVYDSVNTVLTGVDFSDEDKVTGLSKYIVEGNYVDDKDTRGILIGANLLLDTPLLILPLNPILKI